MLGARNRLIMLAVEAEEGAKPEEAETCFKSISSSSSLMCQLSLLSFPLFLNL